MAVWSLATPRFSRCGLWRKNRVKRESESEWLSSQGLAIGDDALRSKRSSGTKHNLQATASSLYFPSCIFKFWIEVSNKFIPFVCECACVEKSFRGWVHRNVDAWMISQPGQARSAVCVSCLSQFAVRGLVVVVMNQSEEDIDFWLKACKQRMAVGGRVVDSSLFPCSPNHISQQESLTADLKSLMDFLPYSRKLEFCILTLNFWTATWRWNLEEAFNLEVILTLSFETANCWIWHIQDME